MATEPAGTAPEVDEDGKPETPVEQAVEKKKHKNLLYAGLALGALGIVVAIYLARKNSAATTAATTANSAIDPSTGLPYASEVAGSSGSADPTGQITQIGLGENQLQTEISTLTSQLGAQNTASLNAQKGLEASIERLTQELAAAGHPPKAPTSGTNKVTNKVNSGAFAQAFAEFAPGAPKVDILGTVGSPTLKNVGASGAPVYALVNGPYGPVYEQGAAVSGAKKGTTLVTLQQFANRVVSPKKK